MAFSQIMWNLFMSKEDYITWGFKQEALLNFILLISLVILNLFCQDHMPQVSQLADHEVNNHRF